MFTEKQKQLLEIALADKQEALAIILSLEEANRVASDVTDIADTVNATAEECAKKINELLASLRAAGILA
ncbi:MAG: hypothetical protein MOGMAGMI_00343 [Candidatus Omnitrophica bacterium]|nr:hypothetical protein [Candidatus Omnitrophota bacterium]